MANNYGQIIVVGEYDGDLRAIVDRLNSLRWSFGCSDGEQHEWFVGVEYACKPDGNYEREIIKLSGDVTCPSLRPMGRFFVLKNGQRCFADDADESFIEQWDNDHGAHEWDECTLSELSGLISPHLTKGAIEFVAARASRTDVSHERLVINANGYAEWHNCDSSNRFGLDRWTRRETEHHPLGY
jgi:hypothetical protein